LTTPECKVEFAVVQYVPLATDWDSINLGVLIVQETEGRIVFADARFNCDRARILAFDPDADVEMLEAICRDIRQKLRDANERESFLRMMEDSFSNSIQLSDRKTISTTDPAAEVDTLARFYLVPESPGL
jgi:hypothetical protein